MPRRRLTRLLPALATLLLLPACERHYEDSWTRIRERGVLRVAVHHGPTTCYVRAGANAGFECELLARFAHELGVRLEVRFVDAFAGLLPAVERGEADVAAGGIAITPRRRQRVRFGPPYAVTTPQVVYHRARSRPRNMLDLQGRHIEVTAGSGHAARLAALGEDYPALAWSEVKGVRVEALLRRVEEQAIDYTLADAAVLDKSRREMPALRPAFSIDRPRPVAWAFPHHGSERLVRRADRFLERLERNGELARLRRQYLGRDGSFDYVDTRTLLNNIETRLPRYRPLFEAAAAETALDWKLLAAVSYQESHWDPQAQSFTGVAGLMMLTHSTASQMGVRDRTDPAQSIGGGARYLKRVMAKIPQRIPEPDRTWLALAAYNVGFGHLEDARILTEAAGMDPDRWADVMKHLPLLADPAWHPRTRFGHARGEEPVQFVENVRRHLDTMRLALGPPRGPPAGADDAVFRYAIGS